MHLRFVVSGLPIDLSFYVVLFRCYFVHFCSFAVAKNVTCACSTLVLGTQLGNGSEDNYVLRRMELPSSSPGDTLAFIPLSRAVKQGADMALPIFSSLVAALRHSAPSINPPSLPPGTQLLPCLQFVRLHPRLAQVLPPLDKGFEDLKKQSKEGSDWVMVYKPTVLQLFEAYAQLLTVRGMAIFSAVAAVYVAVVITAIAALFLLSLSITCCLQCYCRCCKHIKLLTPDSLTLRCPLTLVARMCVAPTSRLRR